jgi:CHAP domain
MEQISIDESVVKSKLLCEIAKLFVGVNEVGHNKGYFVERFQKAVDGKAQGEPWCLAFSFFCVKEVDRIYNVILPVIGSKHDLFESEHCQTTFNKSKAKWLSKPQEGAFMFWAHWPNGKLSSSGHVGIVTKVLSPDTVQTVEGNTGPGAGEVVREGDGVYLKTRNIHHHYGTMRPLGFLKVW